MRSPFYHLIRNVNLLIYQSVWRHTTLVSVIIHLCKAKLSKIAKFNTCYSVIHFISLNIFDLSLLLRFLFQTLLQRSEWKPLARAFPWQAELAAHFCVNSCHFYHSIIKIRKPKFELSTSQTHPYEMHKHKKDSDKSAFQLLRTFISMEIRVKIKLKYKI